MYIMSGPVFNCSKRQFTIALCFTAVSIDGAGGPKRNQDALSGTADSVSFGNGAKMGDGEPFGFLQAVRNFPVDECTELLNALSRSEALPNEVFPKLANMFGAEFNRDPENPNMFVPHPKDPDMFVLSSDKSEFLKTAVLKAKGEDQVRNKDDVLLRDVVVVRAEVESVHGAIEIKFVSDDESTWRVYFQYRDHE